MARGQGQWQGLSSRATITLGYSEEWLTCCSWHISVSNICTPVSKAFFTVSSCTVAVTEFMNVTWSYITDSWQNAKSLKIFKDFVVQEQGQGLVNWSWRILEDKYFPRGLQHSVSDYIHARHSMRSVVSCSWARCQLPDKGRGYASLYRRITRHTIQI